MKTALDVAVTALFAMAIIARWVRLIAFATTGMLAENSGQLTEEQTRKVKNATGLTFFKAIGMTLFLGTMIVLVWIYR